MSTEKYDKTTKFLIDNEYIVKCVVTQKNEVICTYNDVFNTNYYIEHIDGNIYNLHITYKSDKMVMEILCLPSYLIRWYIFLDILRLCRKHKLSHHIVRFFDENGNNKDLSELFVIDMEEDDIVKEANISQSISTILKDSKQINSFDDYYIKIGIFYDFTILKGLMT